MHIAPASSGAPALLQPNFPASLHCPAARRHLAEIPAEPFSTPPESDFWSILRGLALDEVMAGVAFMLLMLALLVLLGLFS